MGSRKRKAVSIWRTGRLRIPTSRVLMSFAFFRRPHFPVLKSIGAKGHSRFMVASKPNAMTVQMTIRDATEADLHRIVAIYNESIPARMSTADTSPVTPEARKKWFSEHSPERRPLWVAEDTPEHIIGWLS